MTKYRKLPIVVEALQYEGQTTEEMEAFLGEYQHYYKYLHKDPDTDERVLCLHLYTLEGSQFADPGDYIIKGVVGEYYPCKPHIFWATYELVDD